MIRGRRPKPTAIRRLEGRLATHGLGRDAPTPLDAVPRCPEHLAPMARAEWRRVARPLHALGLLTSIDRAALAAYCQAYARWVAAEQQLRETPAVVRAASGRVQPSPWIAIASKQLELMARYIGELGLTPTAPMRSGAEQGRGASTRAAAPPALILPGPVRG